MKIDLFCITASAQIVPIETKRQTVFHRSDQPDAPQSGFFFQCRSWDFWSRFVVFGFSSTVERHFLLHCMFKLSFLEKVILAIHSYEGGSIGAIIISDTLSRAV